ncbi:hypothetical protein [Xanthomonas campestris]|uniref:hypothetical protein n=1 Tax=Xanthomonas campestris TaxID=339 RepID=UPI00388D38FA
MGTSNPYPTNLDVAKGILHLLEGECVGMTGEQRVALANSTLDVLRPLADSLWPGHAEAAYMLAGMLPQVDCEDSITGWRMSEEAERYLVEAAACNFADARDVLALQDSRSKGRLSRALEARISELAYDGD